MAVQVRFLADERAVLAEDLARATARAEQLEQQLADAVGDRDNLRAALAEAQQQARSATAAMQTLTADKVSQGPLTPQVSSHAAEAGSQHGGTTR